MMSDNGCSVTLLTCLKGYSALLDFSTALGGARKICAARASQSVFILKTAAPTNRKLLLTFGDAYKKLHALHGAFCMACLKGFEPSTYRVGADTTTLSINLIAKPKTQISPLLWVFSPVYCFSFRAVLSIVL